MSEDREKHDRAGGRDQVKGFKVGRGTEGRRAEMRAGMGQHVPDRVREKMEADRRAAESKGKGKGKDK